MFLSEVHLQTERKKLHEFFTFLRSPWLIQQSAKYAIVPAD